MGIKKQKMKEREQEQKAMFRHPCTERDDRYHEECSQACLRVHDWKETYLCVDCHKTLRRDIRGEAPGKCPTCDSWRIVKIGSKLRVPRAGASKGAWNKFYKTKLPHMKHELKYLEGKHGNETE